MRGITGRSFSYNKEAQVFNAGTVSYEFDQDGFLTDKTNGKEITSYYYSSRGEVLQVALPDGTFVEYLYDPEIARWVAKDPIFFARGK